jgi:hypothetical protein
MFLGMVGYYCMKDFGTDHFGFVHHNVFAKEMNQRKMKYAKFEKVGLNNRVDIFS